MDRYAVIGHPVTHSLSPRIHAAFAAQTGEALSYIALPAPLDGFAATLRAFIDSGGRGANITVPFKEQAYQLATRLSGRARAAGAVNTLSVIADDEEGGLLGDNTDGAGLARDLTANQGFALADRRILLLGAGGAARGVIQPLLAARPALLFIANRTAAKAQRLARGFAVSGAHIRGGGFADIAGCFDLVINATSTGLQDAVLPLSAQVFAAEALAYEMLYGKDTAFMQQARLAGARVCDGLGMLVEQAAEAFALWRGVTPQTAPVLANLRAGA